MRTAVIVTCFNQERFIRQSLDSIATQTVPAAEVVVIDGCSRDRSVSVIEEWMAENAMPVTFIAHRENHGLCYTLNQGMSLITSDAVMTLYGDDWLEPTRIEHQAPLLAATDDDVSMVIGNMREVDRRGIPVVDHDYGPLLRPLIDMTPEGRLESLVTRNVIPSPAVMLKADHVRRVGGYDESLTFDDYDMWLRLLSRTTFRFDPDIVVDYRVLATSLSRNPARHGDFLVSEARMLHKHIGIRPSIDRAISLRLIESLRTLQDSDPARAGTVLSLLADLEETP